MKRADLMGKSRDRDKKSHKKASLSTADLVALAASSGTVTPHQSGTVRTTNVQTPTASTEATPRRLAFASGCPLITSPNIEVQTSTVPVLQGLQDIVAALCGFLVKDGFVDGSDSSESQSW